jgi:hypothetical protein
VGDTAAEQPTAVPAEDPYTSAAEAGVELPTVRVGDPRPSAGTARLPSRHRNGDLGSTAAPPDGIDPSTAVRGRDQ